MTGADIADLHRKLNGISALLALLVVFEFVELFDGWLTTELPDAPFSCSFSSSG